MRCTSLLLAAVVLAPTTAAAHIKITSPTPRSQTVLKQRHCGATGSTRANVQVYRPGSTMRLVWDEYVPHPGWYRISFQQNGDTFEVPPPSTGPNSGGGASNYPTEDLTGKVDPGTNSLIIADRIQHPTLSMDVKLPNVECNNCTLQLTQMMTESATYSDAADSGNIYYACVDLVLSSTAVIPDAGVGPGPMPDAGAAAPGGTTGGCRVDGGGAGWLGLALVGLALRRRQSGRRTL